MLHVSSEVAPWSQTGGLGDVVGALPDALVRLASDVRVDVITPMYRGVAARLAAAGVALDAPLERVVELGPRRLPVALRALRRSGRATIWFVDAPFLYDRDGLYGAAGLDFPDNHLRFAALCRVAVDHGPELLDGPLDVIHSHDWQAGLAPVYLRLDPAQAATGAIFTIHNLAYRGLFGLGVAAELDLPLGELVGTRMEHWHLLSLLKGGLAHADVVTTVSPTYAKEILEPMAGEGFDGFLRHHVPRLVGILNGIDDAAWNPITDPEIAATYSATDRANKEVCRQALAAEHGLTLGPDTMIAVVVSRLAGQKGIDLIADLVPSLHDLDVRLVVVGSGEPALEERLRWLAGAFADNVAVTIGFDVSRARRTYAGADLFLMPSRFEPCGIGQLYAMRYGAIPIAHAVGGLRDTVVDPGDDGLASGHGTGFRFEHCDLPGLRWAVERAVDLRRTNPGAGRPWSARRCAATPRGRRRRASTSSSTGPWRRAVAEARP